MSWMEFIVAEAGAVNCWPRPKPGLPFAPFASEHGTAANVPEPFGL